MQKKFNSFLIIILSLISSSIHAATFTATGSVAVNTVGSRELDNSVIRNMSTSFSGGSQTDSTSGIDISTSVDLSTIGDLVMTITGDMTGILGITIPNLNGGTSVAPISGNTATITFTSGMTNVNNGAVSFTVNGTTNLIPRGFTITVQFDSDGGAGDDETLINAATLTNWYYIDRVPASPVSW